MRRPSLAPFFTAASVAVIGASADPAKVGGSVLANLRAGGFPGRVVAVNPEHARVQGVAAVPSVLEAEGPIDLAVLAVPAPAVQSALEQCVARGVRGAVVLSAGFRESGPEGRAREAALRAWLAGQPLRLLGPNCLGWIRPSARLNLTFAPGMPRPGGLGFFSHSGALCTAILDWSREHAVGFSLFASLGNQADVTEADLLEALAADAETRVILGYVEGVADGTRFFAALRAAAAARPCVLMKAGRSAEGARAVSSHTGALAGSDRAFDAAVRQAGAVRADTLEEMFDLARALVAQPAARNRRVVVVTNGGGLGILATDAARAAGLELPALDPATRTGLARVLPAHAAAGNPVDLVGDAGADRYGDALAVLHDVDAACLVMVAPQAATDAAGIARSILAATRERAAPVLGVLAGGPRVRPGVAVLHEGGVPTYPFPERAVRTLAAMAVLAERRRAARRPPPAPPAIDAGALAEARARLAAAGPRPGYADLAPLLEAHGIPLLPAAVAATPAEAAALAVKVGLPVALKVVSPDVVHKTEVGGVRLGLATPEAARAAAAEMLAGVRAAAPEARLDGVLVQRMAPAGGHELLLGLVRDPQFGPLVVVGFGGIYVEVLDDTAARLAPVDAVEARAMLEALRMAPALRGARGRPPADLEALAQAIARFSWIPVAVPGLTECEVNPLLAGPGGAVALDARAALSPAGPAGRAPGERS